MDYLMVQPIGKEKKTMVVLNNVQYIEPTDTGSKIYFVSGGTLSIADDTKLMYNSLEKMKKQYFIRR